MSGTPPLTKLGIVAGGGTLPALLVEACRAGGRPFHVFLIDGQADDPTLERVPHYRGRIGDVARALAAARAAGVDEIAFAGKVRRPSLKEIRPDRLAAKVLIRAAVRALGDDGLLRAILKEAERLGFKVVGVPSIVAHLLAPEGVLGRHKPDKQARADIARGMAVAKGIGALDIGQAAIVQQGYVLAVEGAEGTDALIARTGPLQRAGAGGVLAKVAKPRQDRRMDLPTVGVGTVESAAKAGLRGVAVEAGGTLVIDRAAVAAAADALGLFVIGVRGDAP